MNFSRKSPLETKTWEKIVAHYEQIKWVHLKEMFDYNPSREKEMSFSWGDFFVDFSKNRWDKDTLNLFNEFADELNLKESISIYFEENKLNFTENRAVLHTALRSGKKEIILEDNNIINDVNVVKQKIKLFSDAVINGSKKGYTEKVFTDVVNIGIGGSDLGPKLVCNALKFYKNHLNTHYISNIDGDELQETLKHIDPETTLFVIVSKSFTTSETLQNAATVKEWFLKRLPKEATQDHFIAVSSKPDLAVNFGICANNVFPIWDWVGGRFSLWSAVGISIALGLGYENFEKLLLGAQKADESFKNDEFDKNIPVLMAFLSVWYSNFYKSTHEAVIPYSYYLYDFVPYLQQGFMESNGKSVDRNSQKISYNTGSVVFGGVGSNAQHAFMQLFHQGTNLVPTDFIGFCNALHGNNDHQNVLISNMLAQSNALAFGTKGEKVDDPFKIFKGNCPSTTILVKKLTPETLGSLIAIYEHKIFVQGILLNINSFDQFGVELGKQLSREYINSLDKESNNDSVLMQFYKKNKK
jgi:glucose-6-phosphate isomerase